MAKCERAGGRSAWVMCRVKQTAGQSQAHFGGANGAEHQDTATIGDERCGVYMEGEGERVLFRARLDGPHPLAPSPSDGEGEPNKVRWSLRCLTRGPPGHRMEKGSEKYTAPLPHLWTLSIRWRGGS